MKKLIIFVDGSNLYHSLKSIGFKPNQIDYHKLFDLISGRKNPFVRFYTAPKRKEHGIKQISAQQSFFDSLKTNPNLSIHFGKLQLIRDEGKISFREKGVDVRLAVDLITLAENNTYDIAILLSGDTDLVPAVENVLNRGKIIVNTYFLTTSGKELRDKSQNAFRITEQTLKNCLR